MIDGAKKITPDAIDRLVSELMENIESEFNGVWDSLVATNFKLQIAGSIRGLYLHPSSDRITHRGIEKNVLYNMEMQRKSAQKKEKSNG